MRILVYILNVRTLCVYVHEHECVGINAVILCA